MRTRESKMRWCALFLSTLVALFLVMWSCTSVQYEPDDTFMEVQNDGFPDAIVYMNGQRLSLVQGLSHTKLRVSRWRLDVNRCALVVVRQIAGPSVSTSRECLRPDEHLELYIGSLLSTTNLVPRQ